MYTEKEIQHIICEKRAAGRSLRKIALDYSGLNYGDIQRAVKGIFPKSSLKRQAFELPEISTVVSVDGAIPSGSQALGARQCPNEKCGHQPFIPNTPRRRKCFICSPYRSKK